MANYVRVKGNQVRDLDDPVTVNGERRCIQSIVRKHEKAQPIVDP